ncbi:hypothetical protein C2E23DRAFT_845714 [Lenzites betulinus]|nr:hypothetical protein C2E23DRAFT_845714 [Lenzites betulinus]
MSPSTSHSLTYPPSAHLPSPDGAQPVQSQPSPVPTMSSAPAKAENETGPAQRIRGGCVPCPDGSICYIIPIPCFCC